MMMTTRTATAPRAPLASTVLDLLDRSRASLLSACHADSVAERYVEAHLAALRAAAALLAARSRPSRRSQLRSVWEAVSYTHLRAHETRHDLVCRLLLE